MKNNNENYVIISPIRNEAEYLPGVIESMVNQTVLPAEWVVVDDGSTDDTAKILKEAANQYKWINYVKKPDRGSRSVGPGVVETFNYGFERLNYKNYNFICKMDGDLEFGREYFETLLRYFRIDPQLGSASGKIFIKENSGKMVEERTSDEMTCGGINFYRREAFEDIGGFVKEVMWDGIAYHMARIHGWRTRSIRNNKLKIIHHRLMGSSQENIFHGRLRWGRGQYFMGTHPLYILGIATYRLIERPYIIGGIGILLGYMISAVKRIQRFNDKSFRKSLHAWQLERLKIGKRLEKLSVPPAKLYNQKFVDNFHVTQNVNSFHCSLQPIHPKI